MLSLMLSHAPLGMEGQIITIEVDLRRGLPGVDIVGLPDNAVREARERVRVAIRNSGFKFPADRLLVNLAPAGLKKEGASFDLPIALGILAASGQIPCECTCAPGSHEFPVPGAPAIMILGELNLSGQVRPVHGVLAAIASGLKECIKTFLVPEANLAEALALQTGRIYGITSLKDAVEKLEGIYAGVPWQSPGPVPVQALTLANPNHGDLSDLRGQPVLKRALEIAAAGKHNLLFFGPPGSGKTMAAKRLATLLPPLDREEALNVTRIYSIAGLLPSGAGLLTSRPFRMPHHSASTEGLVGGGRGSRPGEVSLAHEGVLFLDEAPEFKQNILQSLREPIEDGRVTIVRAGSSVWYPANFQLIMATNSCPCGNLGKPERVCVCSHLEIERYWRKIGGALMDRIDIRVPVKPVPVNDMTRPRGETSTTVRIRVEQAFIRQKARHKGLPFTWNARIMPGYVEQCCALDKKCNMLLVEAVQKLSLSSRACHSILKIARTIADLDNSEQVKEVHILEAVQHRRHGEESQLRSGHRGFPNI